MFYLKNDQQSAKGIVFRKQFVKCTKNFFIFRKMNPNASGGASQTPRKRCVYKFLRFTTLNTGRGLKLVFSL